LSKAFSQFPEEKSPYTLSICVKQGNKGMTSIQLGIDVYKQILTQDKILVKTIRRNTVLHFLVCKVGILIYCYLGIKNSEISM
jgi:hypothetical protein